MLISPARIHSTLSALLGSSSASASSSKPASTSTSTSTSEATSGGGGGGGGIHTALLITPQGQVVSCAHLNDEDVDDDDELSSNKNPNGGVDGADQDDAGNGDGQEEEEPYLEAQERRRLLLGLASQWNEGEGSKMECELGRLHFTYLPLPAPWTASQIGRDSLPAVKPLHVDGFVLVLNGGKGVGWNVFGTKAEYFKQNWRG